MGALYSNMKVFHFREKINSLPKDTHVVKPPLHVRIKPTNACSHRCRYCAYRADNLQLGKDMNIRDYIPKEKIMEIIDDIAEMEVKAVTFSGGGDPFCYPYLLEAVKKLSRTAVKFAVLTNGANLEGEVAEIFAYHGTWLRISMDGWDDESYSFYRGVPKGEFAKVIKNIKNFKMLGGGCYLSICLIVDRNNFSRVYDFIGKLRDLHVNSVKIAPCIVSNRGNENSEYHKPIFNTVREQIMKAIDNFLDDDFEIFDSYHTQLETFKKEYTWCPYLQIVPVIGADLNIYPCHDKAYNLDEGLIGSIKAQRFKEFWFFNKSNFFKINPSVVCNHHCVANTKNRLLLDYMNTNKDHLEFV